MTRPGAPNEAEQRLFACANPELCFQEFAHIKAQVESLAKKVGEMNTKLFENNGESYSTRVSLLEDWREQELKAQSRLKTAMITLCTLIVIQIGLSFFNNLFLRSSLSLLQKHDYIVHQQVVPGVTNPPKSEPSQ